MKKGFSEGKKIGELIKLIEKEWVDKGYNLPEKNLQEILNKSAN